MINYQIYRLARSLGQKEKHVRDNYTYSEIFERVLFDSHDNYIQSKMNELDT